MGICAFLYISEVNTLAVEDFIFESKSIEIENDNKIIAKDGVKVTEDYSDVELNWETTTAGLKMLENIEKKANGYEKIYLATDPDREGEAITWHLVKSLEKNLGICEQWPSKKYFQGF